MSSPAPKQAETEFDDLLGQLVDELAMTPASESAVQLVNIPAPADARVDSTHHMAAEAAAAAGARAQVGAAQVAPAGNNLVKIVGIITASLTVVAVAALVVFAGGDQPRTANSDAVAVGQSQEAEQIAALAATEQAAAERADADARATERAELAARDARIAADLLSQDAKAKAEAAAPTPKPRVRKRPKPKNKPTATKSGDSFDDM